MAISRGAAGRAIQINPAHESEIATHAVASDEVGVVEKAMQVGDIDKILIERDVPVERIGKSLAGSDALAGQRGIQKLRQYVHAGAGAADRRAAGDQIVELGFDRSVLSRN